MAKKRYWKRQNANTGSVTHFTRNGITGTVTTYTETADQVSARKKKHSKILKLVFGVLFLGAAFAGSGGGLLVSVICLVIAAVLLWSGLKKS